MKKCASSRKTSFPIRIRKDNILLCRINKLSHYHERIMDFEIHVNIFHSSSRFDFQSCNLSLGKYIWAHSSTVRAFHDRNFITFLSFSTTMKRIVTKYLSALYRVTFELQFQFFASPCDRKCCSESESNFDLFYYSKMLFWINWATGWSLLVIWFAFYQVSKYRFTSGHTFPFSLQ